MTMLLTNNLEAGLSLEAKFTEMRELFRALGVAFGIFEINGGIQAVSSFPASDKIALDG